MVWNFKTFALHVTLHIDKFEVAKFKHSNMIIISEIATQKDLNKTFLSQIYEFYFCTKLCKYNNSFFKFLSKKRQVIYFLCQIQKFLYICTRLCANWRLLISNMGFSVPHLNFFVFCMKLCILTNSGVLNSYVTLVFWNCSTKKSE